MLSRFLQVAKIYVMVADDIVIIAAGPLTFRGITCDSFGGRLRQFDFPSTLHSLNSLNSLNSLLSLLSL